MTKLGDSFQSLLSVGMTYTVYGKEADVSTNSTTANFWLIPNPVPCPHPPPLQNFSAITK